MSLINQMLQDLDARNGGNSGVIVPQAAVRPVAGAESSRSLVIGVVALCVVAGAAGAWYWFNSKAASTPPSAQPVAAAKPAQPVQPARPTAPPQDIVVKVEQPPAQQVSASVPKVEASAPVVAAAPAPAPVKPMKDLKEPQNGQLQMDANPSRVAAAPVAAKKRIEVAANSSDITPVSSPAPKVVAAASGTPTAMPVKQVRELTPYQRAENEYRRASGLAAQGKTSDASAALERALQLDPRHVAARQMLATMMVEGGRADDAISLLKAGIALDQTQPSLAMALARLQVEKGDAKAALDTLQGGLPYAAEYADYHAFLAALLQRVERHKEAVDEYGAALRIAPQNGLWWMGIGISLQADNRPKDARDAYVRAKASDTLSAELQAFVDQKLAQLH